MEEEDLRFLETCQAWMNAKVPQYEFAKRISTDERCILIAIGYVVWGDKIKFICQSDRDSIDSLAEAMMYEHAFGEIFTKYRKYDSLFFNTPVEVSIDYAPHVAQTLEYAPSNIEILSPIICLCIVILLFFWASCFREFAAIIILLSGIPVFILLVMMKLWKRNRLYHSVIVALWGGETGKLMRSQSFLSFVCYRYVNTKMNERHRKICKKFILNHPDFSKLPAPPPTATPCNPSTDPLARAEENRSAGARTQVGS